jgi:hypothetical protein
MFILQEAPLYQNFFQPEMKGNIFVSGKLSTDFLTFQGPLPANQGMANHCLTAPYPVAVL